MLNKGIYNQNKSTNRIINNGVCRFFLRGMCTWGEGCKYFHLSKSVIFIFIYFIIVLFSNSVFLI